MIKRWLHNLFGPKAPPPARDGPVVPPKNEKPREVREAEFLEDWNRARKSGVVDVRALRKKHNLLKS